MIKYESEFQKMSSYFCTSFEINLLTRAHPRLGSILFSCSMSRRKRVQGADKQFHSIESALSHISPSTETADMFYFSFLFCISVAILQHYERSPTFPSTTLTLIVIFSPFL